MKLKWLSNIYDPKMPDAKMLVARSFEQTQEEAWRWHMYWLRDKVIGKPVPTDYYTVEQLVGMNMVGVYMFVED